MYILIITDFFLHLNRLVSTNGYVVIDDSGHPQFDGADWPWVVNQTFPPPDSATCAQVDPFNVR